MYIFIFYVTKVPGTPEPPSISDELSVELIAGIAGGAGIAALILLLVLCACGMIVTCTLKCTYL